MVIESTSPEYKLPFPVVAIYPREGTFWSDHPVGIVRRDGVHVRSTGAARIYIDHLLARPQQSGRSSTGSARRTWTSRSARRFDTAHGIDPKEPQTTLEVPSVEVIDAVLQLWNENKKRAEVTLVLDVSGSMNEERKIDAARAGAEQLVALLDEQDHFSLLPFNDRAVWAVQKVPMSHARASTVEHDPRSVRSEGTALYARSPRPLTDLAAAGPGRISALVV